MSTPDHIHCKMALPADCPDCIRKSPFFQTSDLGNSGSEWVITKDGQIYFARSVVGNILAEALQIELPPLPVVWKRKRIEMWGSNIRGGAPRGKDYVFFTKDGSDCVDITYVVQVRNGKVSSIKEKCRNVKPARPMAEFE